MEIKITLFSILNTLGALQALLIALALITIKTDHRLPNRILAAFLVALSVIVVDFILYDTALFLKVPHFYDVASPVIFLLGPLLYFYARSLTIPGFTFQRRDILHLLPAVLVFLMSLPSYFQNTSSKIQHVLDEIGQTEFSLNYFMSNAIVDGSIFIYLVAALRIARRATREHPAEHLSWLTALLTALLLVAGLSTAFDFFPYQKGNWYITPLCLTFIVYSMGYVGLRESHVFRPRNPGIRPEKYAKSTLTPEQTDKIMARLEILMRDEKLFADPTLSLPKLAKTLKVTRHHLSQVLNQQFQQNFFQYINRYRVEEAKRKMLAPVTKDYTFAAIAASVGFNSVSAFNAAFKKQVGMSPTAYKKTGDLTTL